MVKIEIGPLGLIGSHVSSEDRTRGPSRERIGLSIAGALQSFKPYPTAHRSSRDDSYAGQAILKRGFDVPQTKFRVRAMILVVACLVTGCSDKTAPESVPPKAAGPRIIRIEPGADAPKKAQEALILAQPGEVVEFGEGTFEFRSTLSLDVNGVTVRGQGPDKTVLNFREQGQGTGGEGLLATSKKDFTLENLAIVDAKGDAVKVQGTDKAVFRNIRVSWSGGPSEKNGGYGIYPVLCQNVLIEDCQVSGASDAGIYVGQSKTIVVRRNTASGNVAGIEIENSVDAEVHDNLATDNAGGILIFSLPDLPKKEGRNCRLHKNRVVANNHPNFAPKGNIVATVPSGTGVMIMANDNVEIFDNTIENNNHAGVSVLSYLITGKPIADKDYDPFCEGIAIHSNRFSGNGKQPAGELGGILSQILGSPLPDILYDGILDPKKPSDGLAVIRLRDNGNAGFANFDAGSLTPEAIGAGKKPNVVRDLAAYTGALPPLPAVSIEGLK